LRIGGEVEHQTDAHGGKKGGGEEWLELFL